MSAENKAKEIMAKCEDWSEDEGMVLIASEVEKEIVTLITDYERRVAELTKKLNSHPFFATTKNGETKILACSNCDALESRLAKAVEALKRIADPNDQSVSMMLIAEVCLKQLTKQDGDK